MNQGVLNSYCWMYSTFNIPPAFQVRHHDGDKDDDDDDSDDEENEDSDDSDDVTG